MKNVNNSKSSNSGCCLAFAQLDRAVKSVTYEKKRVLRKD